MTNQQNSNDIQNGQIIERPSEYNKIQGVLTGMKWDSNNKSAFFFFSQDRTTGSGDNKKTTWIPFVVRLWNREAQFLEAIHLHKVENTKQRKTNNQIAKFSALINLSVRTANYARPTGRFWGENNDQPVTKDEMFYEGKETLLLNPKTRAVEAQGRFHKTPEELAAEQPQRA